MKQYRINLIDGVWYEIEYPRNPASEILAEFRTVSLRDQTAKHIFWAPSLERELVLEVSKIISIEELPPDDPNNPESPQAWNKLIKYKE